MPVEEKNVALKANELKLVRAIDTVGSLLKLSPLSYGGRQVFQDIYSAFPADAGVCDADALLESRWTFCRHALLALIDVGFDHDADNATLAFSNLFSDRARYLGLIAVVLVGIS